MAFSPSQTPTDGAANQARWYAVIGLDGYFALTNRSDPTLAQLVAALTNFHTAYQKPVIFTEIGYKSSAGANTEPWNYSHVGAYDPTEQRNCVDAAFTVWSQWSSWMEGFFWWAWPVPAPSATDTDYNLRGNVIAEVTSNAGIAVTPATITGAAPPSPSPQTVLNPTVLIDGPPATLSWAGLAPGFVGLYQVNAQVPATLSAGSHQLQLVVNGAASNTVTFAVR